VVVDLAAVGGGVPDLLCYRRSTGLLRLLEIKNPETTAKNHRKVNRKMSETEIKQIAFRSVVPTWVVKTVDKALAAMGVEVVPAIPLSRTVRAIPERPSMDISSSPQHTKS